MMPTPFARLARATLLAAVALLAVPVAATPEPTIPDALQPWVPWVLESGPERQDQRACPIQASDGARLCAWAGRLRLDIDAAGGRFEQHWRIFAPTWIDLPGDARHWPLAVAADGQARAVVMRDGRPAVRLPAGEHRLGGSFRWDRVPDTLPVPPATGLLELRRDGRAVANPRLDAQSRLWLGGAAASEDSAKIPEGDALSLEVQRLIQDRLPLEVLTRLQLEVSGRAREIQLGPVLLPGTIPLRLDSPLPARLEDDRSLRVQVRPGRWILELAAHQPGAVTELRRPAANAPWPAREYWAFVAQPELRRVEVSGAEPVDPRQTLVPADWQRWPVYRIESGGGLRFAELARGDADPGPDRLRLRRQLWLDFDGHGYSVQDRIQGQLSRAWRLDAAPSLALGQVRLNDRPVLITQREADAPSGIEVRRGALDLVADARLESHPGQVPASGWALEFEAVATTLALPPGWDLLLIQGVDNVPNAWVNRWSLLDLFLVLILAIGIGRLWGWGWGALALLALTLTWQTPGAPRLIWLHLLAAAALLRLLPAAAERTGIRRLRLAVTLYFRLALLALALIGLPFLVTQVRDGLFPHLERSHTRIDAQMQYGGAGGIGGAMPPAPQFASAPEYSLPGILESLDEASAIARESARVAKAPAPPPAVPEPLEALDPQARLQTGPGIPQWRWQSFELGWSGPVRPDESARLWLLNPTGHLLVSLGGALLLVLLALRLAWTRAAPPDRPLPAAALAPSLLLLAGCGGLLLSMALAPRPSLAADRPDSGFPSAVLLDELRARLLAPPECLPRCVELPRLTLTANPERLTLDLELDVAAAVAAPIPGGAGGWLPSDIFINGMPASGLRRGPNGVLLLPLSAGRHAIRLGGPTLGRERLELALPMTPRTLSSALDGWILEGQDPSGEVGGLLRLVRDAAVATATDATWSPEALPPLLRVERHLRLGLDWRVDTRVTRLSPVDFPVLLPIALLPGETVQTPGIGVERGAVRADLPAGRTAFAWSSRLEPVTSLRLTASEDSRLSEEWRLEVATLWHLETADLAPIHRLGAGDRWLPTWRPLPGESLTLTLSRPVGVPGPTLTIDQVEAQVAPGPRGTLSTLHLRVRSSQGGRHAIRLPDGAEPLNLRVDGRELPLPSAAPALELPLTPGAARFEVIWRTPTPLTPVYVPDSPDLGAPAVNLHLSMQLPTDRWVLWTWGPPVGPAVLFWGLFLVLIVLSAVLARARLTPLRPHDWFLLGCGLILAELWVTLLVVGWLFALGWRHGRDPLSGPAWRFNLQQVGLILLTLAALAGLVGAVQYGLLGTPAMQILGNGSSATHLHWYQDRGGPQWPEAGVVSVPLWVYRALMLAWALWLALRLLAWLRWGWEGFSRPLLWRDRPRRPAAGGSPASAATPKTTEMTLDLREP